MITLIFPLALIIHLLRHSLDIVPERDDVELSADTVRGRRYGPESEGDAHVELRRRAVLQALSEVP
jgi:hypothetical protein